MLSETQTDRIKSIIKEVDQGRASYVKPIDELTSCFRIGPPTMLEQCGYEDTATFLRDNRKMSVEAIVAYITKALTVLDGRKAPTINIINIEGDHNTVTIHQPKARKPHTKPSRITFRLLDDATLTLEDRIIYSLAHQYAYNNTKRAEQKREAKPITVNRFRKDTSFRHATVTASLQRLQDRLYLDGDLAPVGGENRLKGFAKLPLANSGHGIGVDVFVAYAANVANKGKRANATYLMKYTGVSRSTAYRWKKFLGLFH